MCKHAVLQDNVSVKHIDMQFRNARARQAVRAYPEFKVYPGENVSVIILILTDVAITEIIYIFQDINSSSVTWKLQNNKRAMIGWVDAGNVEKQGGDSIVKCVFE